MQKKKKRRNRPDSFAKARPPNELPLDPQEDNHWRWKKTQLRPEQAESELGSV